MPHLQRGITKPCPFVSHAVSAVQSCLTCPFASILATTTVTANKPEIEKLRNFMQWNGYFNTPTGNGLGSTVCHMQLPLYLSFQLEFCFWALQFHWIHQICIAYKMPQIRVHVCYVRGQFLSCHFVHVRRLSSNHKYCVLSMYNLHIHGVFKNHFLLGGSG